MNIFAKLGTAAALLGAVFFYGRCSGIRSATDAVSRERAANNMLTSKQGAELSRLTGENARLRVQSRLDSLKHVAEAPTHSVLVAAAEKIFQGALTPPIDVRRLDAEPLRPDMPNVPVVPDSIVNVLFPGGAWVVTLPHDPRPHLADSALFHWGLWADRQLTLNRIRMRDTIGPAFQQLKRSNTAYATLVVIKDSIIANADSMNRIYRTALEDKGLATLAQQRRGTVIYAGLLASGVAANHWLKIDRDAGNYVDSWRTGDKLTHAFAGALLASTAHDALKVPWKWSVPLTCAGAAGYEWSQGVASGKDWFAGCAGAGVTALLRRGIDKLGGR